MIKETPSSKLYRQVYLVVIKKGTSSFCAQDTAEMAVANYCKYFAIPSQSTHKVTHERTD